MSKIRIHRVWILRIHDPLLDFTKKTQNLFFDSEITKKKRHPRYCGILRHARHLIGTFFLELSSAFNKISNLFLKNNTATDKRSYVPSVGHSKFPLKMRVAHILSVRFHNWFAWRGGRTYGRSHDCLIAKTKISGFGRLPYFLTAQLNTINF